MDKIKKIRLENIKLLVNPEARGNIVKFAKKYDLNEVQISAWLNKSRNIGEKLARRLEQKLGIQKGGLDVPGMGSGSDPALEIENAINRADFLSNDEKKGFISMIRAIKAKTKEREK